MKGMTSMSGGFRGVDKDPAEAVVRDLRTGADEIDHAMREIDDILDATTWTGDDATKLTASWNELRHRMFQVSLAMRNHAQQLANHTDKQEHVSAIPTS